MTLPDHPVRSFVALPCPPRLRQAIAAARPGWKTAGEGVRWTPPERAHLTLRFLGTAEPGPLAALNDALGGIAARHGAIRLVPAATGAFPDWRRPRVLWLGLEPSTPLADLAADIEAAARAAGFPAEERALRPHLTLGRVKDARGAEAAIEAVRAWTPGTGAEEAPEIVLYESQTGSAGARHTPLARHSLEGGS